MNHWIKRRETKRKFDVTISMGGHKARLTEVRINIRETINSIEMTINTDKQSLEELGEFYHILGSVFIDLSSFTEPKEAIITVVPNDQTKDGFILSGAIALATNFHEVTGQTGQETINVDVSFSYEVKKSLPYISI